MSEPENATAHPPAPKALVRKLCEVMAQLDRVPKRGRNQNLGYDFATESDITDALRKHLAEKNVIIFPSVDLIELGQPFMTRGGSQQWITTVWMTFSFMDAESGEVWAVRWPGQAQDGSDKGIYKSITGALKFLLLKTFLISTGEAMDPETDTHQDQRTQTEGAPAAAQRETRQAAPPGEPMVIEGTVTMVATEASKSGKEFCAVYVRRTRYTSFDKKLFPALLASSEKVIRIRVVQVARGGKKFWNILEVLPPADGVPATSTDITEGPWNDVPAA